ncbi:hypothetical protein C8Q70DRAFT_275525 [Cubamyces menziesii]|nr:hypothetical protein C8Q70DRAFT_275525 [Cubamyces menziesii]
MIHLASTSLIMPIRSARCWIVSMADRDRMAFAFHSELLTAPLVEVERSNMLTVRMIHGGSMLTGWQFRLPSGSSICKRRLGRAGYQNPECPHWIAASRSDHSSPYNVASNSCSLAQAHESWLTATPLVHGPRLTLK